MDRFKLNALLLVLSAAPPFAQSEAANTELNEIEVSSQAEDRSTTEGSGSFTTDSNL